MRRVPFRQLGILMILALSWGLCRGFAETHLAQQIQEIQLDNGLRIFVLERHASPTVATYYRFGVGGAMDPKGESGISHLLEHMMFKGTESLGTLNYSEERRLMKRLTELWHELHVELDKAEDPFQPKESERADALRKEIEEISARQKDLIVKNEYDELLKRAGAVGMNASTGNDSTQYYVQLPSNRLELWFQLESDRLLHPVFREFYSERDVVHQERREGTENNPGGQVWEALQGLMYPAHPYGRPIIGWPRDIERLTQEDALSYFRTYYSPSNCIMVFVGDVTPCEIQKLAQRYWGPWKRQEIPPLRITSELEQKGERRRIVEFDAQPELSMAWVTVPEGHEDQYALDVLGDVLGGLSSSRLDKTIVQEEKLATSVSAGHPTRKYAGFFMASGDVAPGRTAQELENAVEREIRKIQEEGVNPQELDRAKIRLEVAYAQRLKSNDELASHIGWVVGATGGLDYLDDYEKRMNAVTPEQVQAVARKYLLPHRKNVVEVKKVEKAGSPDQEGASGVTHRDSSPPGERGVAHSQAFKKWMRALEQAPPLQIKVPEVGKDVDRVVLASGPVVFIKEDHTAPCVQMSLAWLGGSNTTPVERLAGFELAGQFLSEGGTESLEPMALQERKEDLGMSFWISMGATQSTAGFWCLSRLFDDSFGLAMDMVMKPRLDPARFEVIKGQYADSMRRRYDNPGWAVYILMEQLLYREDPRLGYQATKAEIDAVAREDIRALWQRYTGKDNLFIAMTGDFDKSVMLARLEAAFSSWRNAEDKARDFLAREPVSLPGVFVVGKEVSSPAIHMVAQNRLDRTLPAKDHAALDILDDILGGSGFRSRLMERLRSDEGLTYGVWSYVSHEGRLGVPGSLGISYETQKATVARSVLATLEEVEKIKTTPVTESEVREQIDSWKNRFVFKFEDDFYSVSRLMNHELDDRPFDRDKQVLDEVTQVKAADVLRVAQSYLDPKAMTIGVFGAVTEEDRQALEQKYGLKIVPKEEIFKGGFDQ